MDLAHVTIPFSSSHPLLPSSTSAPSCNHCRNISGRANSAAPWRHENPWLVFFRNDQLEIYLWNLPRFFVEEATLSKPTIIINIYCIGPTHLFFIFISWSKIKSIIKSILYSHPPHRQPKKTFKTKTRKHKKKHSPSDLQSISPLPKKKLHTTPSTFIEIWLPRYVAWSVFHQPSVGPPHNFHALEPLRHLRLYHHASPSFWMGVLVCIVIDSHVIIYSMIDICLQQILLYLPLPYFFTWWVLTFSSASEHCRLPV